MPVESKYDIEEDELAASKAPLIAHLLELRKRIIWCLIAWFFGFVVSYMFRDSIYGFLMQPLADSFVNADAEIDRRLIYTSLPETFVTYVKLSLFAGFFLAFPVIATQFYLFVSPGLYKYERLILLPYIVISPLLFIAGAALAYYYVFPMAWQFFISFENTDNSLPLPIELETKVADYLRLVMQLLFAFGLAFQLPVVLTMMVKIGIITTSWLAKGRKYALVVIVTAAAILTPPDIISQIALAIPLYLLYELSIICCKIVERKSE